MRAKNAGSLLWLQGDLYDVAQGWRRVDGTQETGAQWAAFGDFDMALLSPREDLVALVDSDGTKALLLEPGGRVVRELNRSWYCASAYRFPLALLSLPSGETGVAYCPDNYNQIEIEVARTGERLTAHGNRQSADVFHSRLQGSPDGARLLSAGWLWHPIGVAQVYDIGDALRKPHTLDPLWGDSAKGLSQAVDAEVAGACWVTDTDLVLATSDETFENGTGLGTRTLARWSTATEDFIWQRSVDHDLGDLVSFHGNVLAVNGHPRLFDSGSGDLIADWESLATPTTRSSHR